MAADRFPIAAVFYQIFLAGTIAAFSDCREFKEPDLLRIKPEGKSICKRFIPPEGFSRIPIAQGKFGDFLRNLPVKRHGEPVRLYNGALKSRHVHAAVVDLDVGTRDLQQCADAVIRLRAEYLFQRSEFERIGFHFTNGFFASYTRWRRGERIRVKGNRAEWVAAAEPDPSYRSFRSYLNVVFSYAGTISLANELQPVSPENLRTGDVFIRAGSPGHAVIVIDAARDERSGETIFLLAQSYMPAQEIHVLRNFSDSSIDPWYRLNGDVLETPEWTFRFSDLRRFPEMTP